MYRSAALLLVVLCATSLLAQPAPPPSLADESVHKSWDAFRQMVGKDWIAQWTKDGRHIVAFSGASTNLATRADLGVGGAAAVSGADVATLNDITSRKLDGVQQFVIQQQYRARPGAPPEPIENARVVVSVSRNAVYDVTINSVPDQVAPTAIRSRSSAVQTAKKLLDADLDRLTDEDGKKLRVRFPHIKVDEAEPTSDRTALISVGPKLFRVFRVKVRAFVTISSRPTNIVLREYAIDANSTAQDGSAVVQRKDLLHLGRHVQMRVFDPNPLTTLNECHLDAAANLDEAMTTFDVVVRDAVGGSLFPSGATVQICDIEGPPTAPPHVADAAMPQFVFDHGKPEFAAAMAYVHLDAMQTYVRDKLGFADLVMPVQVDVDGSDLDTSIHACYSDTPEGDGYLSFGHRPGAFLAEDGELVAHEYGHVLLFRTTAGRFEIARDASHPESEAGAISEGFADYWALSTFYEKTKASGHRIDCFGEWAKGGPCMRTASDKSFHDDFIDGANDHVNGEVWLSMLFDLFRAMHFDRDKANTIILLGHLNRADRGLAPTMAEIADGIVTADVQVFNGRHKEAACAVFMLHGLSSLPCCAEKTCGATFGPAITLPPPVPTRPRRLADHCVAPALVHGGH